MESLRGQLLIASPRLLDPNFAQAVILIVQHGEEGALGLVLNRPTEMSVDQVYEKILEESYDSDGVLCQGGPCEGPLMVLHEHEPAADAEVIPGVFFTTDREKIELLLRERVAADDPRRLPRFFVGYAGWGVGQIEAELETGSWLRLAADPGRIFEDALDRQWARLLTRATLGQWINPDQIPEDPSLN